MTEPLKKICDFCSMEMIGAPLGSMIKKVQIFDGKPKVLVKVVAESSDYYFNRLCNTCKQAATDLAIEFKASP